MESHRVQVRNLTQSFTSCVILGKPYNLVECFFIREVAMIMTQLRLRLEIFEIMAKKLLATLLGTYGVSRW